VISRCGKLVNEIIGYLAASAHRSPTSLSVKTSPGDATQRDKTTRHLPDTRREKLLLYNSSQYDTSNRYRYRIRIFIGSGY